MAVPDAAAFDVAEVTLAIRPEFRAARGIELRGEQPAAVTGRVIARMRRTIPGPGPDRYLAPEIASAVSLVESRELLKELP